MADEKANGRKTSVFISYSRKDKLFVRKLNDALDAAGINAWVDWEGIPLSAEWMAEITRAVQAAYAFLFIISLESLTSKVCKQELELGLFLNKKLVPILYREPEKPKAMHPKLSATNWVYLRTKKDDFKSTIPKLIDAIETDLTWVRQHTPLLERAVEGNGKNRNHSDQLQQGSTITSLDFTSNDQILASGSSNGFAYLWDLQNGEELACLPHSNTVTSVSFSADNSLLITASRKVVQVWDVKAIQPIRTEDITQIACSRLTENMSQTNWAIFFPGETYRELCTDLIAGK